MQSPSVSQGHTAPPAGAETLRFVHPTPPAPGQTIEIAPGILWARLTLPFLLDHVNIYFVDDGDGWALIDTGLGNKATLAAWEPLLGTVLRDRPLTRIIATHFHPDHVGAAGFLLQRFNVPLYMAATEYLQCLNLHLDPGALEAEHYRRFYLDHGLDADTTQRVVTGGHAYLKLLSGLPPTYHRLVAGDALRIGGRDFDVLTGGGHSPEQIMLVARADKLFFSADQVLAKISPNVSVSAVDPEGDPLGQFLRSLQALRGDIDRRRHGVAGAQSAVLRLAGTDRRTDCAPLRALRAHSAGLPDGAALRGRACAVRLCPRARSASDGLCFRRGAGPRQFLLRRGSLRPLEGAQGATRGTKRVTAA